MKNQNYNRLDYTNINNLNYLKNSNSYENYLNFLKVMNWSIISIWDAYYSNEKLFKEGLNLLIDTNSDDVTNDIKILCPISNFLIIFMMIIKKYLYYWKIIYEPIYIYNNQIKISITRLFN